MVLRGPAAAGVLASYFVTIAVVLVVIVARIHLRINIQKQRLLASDILMITAWLSAIATASFDIVFLKEGALKPEIDYTLSNYVPKSIESFEYLLSMIWASSIPFFTTFYLCKASILTMYLQIFPVFMKKRRLALWLTIGYCCVAYIASLTLHIFICFPTRRNWTLTDPSLEACPTIYMARVFQVAWTLHFFGSVVIFILPFAVIYKIQMRTRMKVGLFAVLGLGIIDIAFSLTRFCTVQLGNDQDFRSMTLIELWSGLDVNVGLLIACLPSLRPYLRHNLKASNDYQYYGSSGPPKSNPVRRPDQSGFEEIGDTRFDLENTRRASVGPATSEFGMDGRWSDDKKSSRSDIELVQVTASKSGGPTMP